jgi:hypothetical protein
MRRLIKSLFLIAITGVEFLDPASGQIQETRDQLKARYGAAMSVGGQDVFKQPPFHITVFYDDRGRSKLMIYALEESVDVNSQEAQGILRKTLDDLASGQSWSIIENKVSETTYIRSDKKLFARIDLKQGILFSLTPEAMRAYERGK